MDTRTICLGVLCRGPATGYHIKRTVEEQFGFFLNISHGSIYPALAGLHKDGLVSREEVRQDGKPDKKVYRLTSTGERALAAGLESSPGRHRVRSEFLVVLVFARYLSPARLADLLDERQAEFARLEAFAEPIAAGRDDCDADPGSRFAAGLCVALMRAGTEYIEANRGWLETNGCAPDGAPAAEGLG